MPRGYERYKKEWVSSDLIGSDQIMEAYLPLQDIASNSALTRKQPRLLRKSMKRIFILMLMLLFTSISHATKI